MQISNRNSTTRGQLRTLEDSFRGFFLVSYSLSGLSMNGLAKNIYLLDATAVKSRHKMYQCILRVISLILLIVRFNVGLLMLFRGVNANDSCSWCHYLSCVPTSKWSCNSGRLYCLVIKLHFQCSFYDKNDVLFMSFCVKPHLHDLDAVNQPILAVTTH